MNRERIERWITALRSDDYKQGYGRLHNPEVNTFCCLGVACDLFKDEVGLKTTTGILYDRLTIEYNGLSGTMPTVLRDYLKINHELQSKLVRLNDVWYRNFHEIADEIEEELNATNP